MRSIVEMSPLNSSAIKAGMIGGLVLTIGMAMTRALEVTPINIELALGSLLTRSFDSVSWMIGFTAHLIMCGAIALVYAAGFESLKRFGFMIGMLFGVVHWIVSGVAMGIMPSMYSLVPEMFGPPGFFGSDFGPITVAGNCVTHLLYGAAVGVLYDSARVRQLAPTVLTRDATESLRRVA